MGTGLPSKLQALIPKFWECPACQEAVRPWKSIGVVLLGALAVAFFLNRSHRALGDARREAEAARLALGQQIVASQGSEKDMRASLKDLTDQNELLREAYEQAVKAAPDAKPESTASLVTRPVVVSGAPRPTAPPKEPQIAEEDPGVHPPAPPPCDAPLVADGRGGWSCPARAAGKPAACVLSAGDLGSFRVDQVVLRTEAGNRLVAGTAEFWRESPAPRSKLAAGAFSSGLSDVDTLAQDAPPRWGAEAAALCTRDGCGLGAGLLLPPFRVPLLGLGLRAEARVDAYAGPSLALAGALGVRW